MRGTILAFHDEDHSNTYNVRDWPPQLCTNQKTRRHSLERVVMPSIFPSFLNMLLCPKMGRSESSLYRSGATTASRYDLLLGNSSCDLIVAKETPRSIKHFQ
ncbi:hypothetical protein M9H77_35883 [Catharanthus roseus]|uniref:Uncharacterized protein n=1 Tax=Catharanthus roseus TaxID=4058 RepID=A0ACB9ZQL0_CATRO|nr:hypothetical protein M9H77_35883 [Catharanthus roseus]